MFPSYAAEAIDVKSFRRKRPAGVIRSDFESGARQQVRIVRRVLISERFNITISKDDYEAFKEWYSDAINKVDWFSYRPPGQATDEQTRLVGGEITNEQPLDSALSRWQIQLAVEYWSRS